MPHVNVRPNASVVNVCPPLTAIGARWAVSAALVKRATRDNFVRILTYLARLTSAAGTDENLIPLLVDCARAYCTEGEIVDALRGPFGEYTENPSF